MSNTLFDLSGKTAVITGSSRGIGKAIAVRLADYGAKVVVSSRKIDACNLVVDEINNSGGEAFACECNISSKEALQNMANFSSFWPKFSDFSDFSDFFLIRYDLLDQ